MEVCSGREMEGRLLGWVEEGVWVLTKASNPAGNGRRKELDVGGGAAALAARRRSIPVRVEHGRACCCAVEVEDEVGEAPAERTGGGRDRGWPAQQQLCSALVCARRRRRRGRLEHGTCWPVRETSERNIWTHKLYPISTNDQVKLPINPN